MMMRALRPIWGKLQPPNSGEIKINMGREIKRVRGNTYEIRSQNVRFTINPHIAETDLETVR